MIDLIIERIKTFIRMDGSYMKIKSRVLEPELIDQIKEELVMLNLTGHLSVHVHGDYMSVWRNRRNIFMIYSVYIGEKISYRIRLEENRDIGQEPYDVSHPDDAFDIIKNRIKEVILQESII